MPKKTEFAAKGISTKHWIKILKFCVHGHSGFVEQAESFLTAMLIHLDTWMDINIRLTVIQNDIIVLLCISACRDPTIVTYL